MTFKMNNHKASKLKGEQVLRIRELYTQRGVTQAALARQFRVSVNTIANIVNGITWQGLLGSLPPVDRPPPNAEPVVPTDQELAESQARLEKLIQPRGEVLNRPSLYQSPPGYEQIELSDALAARIAGELGRVKPSVDGELKDFLNDGETTEETDE